MAVNVSARQLDTDQITADIEAALFNSGLDAEALTIEVTETTLMSNVEETARRLTAIKRSACRSRSMTSAPDTPPLPICSGFPSMR